MPDQPEPILLSYEEMLRILAAIEEAQTALNAPFDMRTLLHAHTSLHEAMAIIELASHMVNTH